MAKYLLDTTVLIDHLRGRKTATDLLTSLIDQGHQLGVCCINVAELYAGLNADQQANAESLVGSLDYYELGREAAKVAGAYRYQYRRQGSTLSITDSLIAAAAVAEGATLITANARHFPMPEIEVLRQP